MTTTQSPPILAIVNQKGGVGKTTTAINLACYLAEFGHKTLLIDADPQANSTSGIGLDQAQLTHSLYDILIDPAQLEHALCPSPFPRLHVIPGHQNLASIDLDIGSMVSRETRLKDCLAPLHPFYDFMIIDCPPAINLITVNAMVAATASIIPVQCEYFALEGLAYLTKTQVLIRENFNPSLDLLGILPTMYDSRTSLNRQVIANIESVVPNQVFSAIPRNIKLSEAPSHGLPVQLYAPKSKGAKRYQQFTQEVLHRVKQPAT
jgi:chromosome partitioning protein